MRKYTTTNRRQSIYQSERRDPRVVRDKEYQTNCLEKLTTFLTEKYYDGNISNINPPSVRDFQGIFKFLISFLLPDYEYLRFEEDVLNILRILKYPYVNEINRSQLITITPHVWPVVLSMMEWVIGLYDRLNMVNYEKNTFDMLFFDYLSDGYLKFLEGKTDLDSNFEKKIKSFYEKENKKLDERKEYLDGVNVKVKELESVNLVDNKKTLQEMLDDKKSLSANEVSLDENISKTVENIRELNEELRMIENANSKFKEEEEKMLKIISEQPINPNEVKEMNTEKMELLKEIENIKPRKEEKFQNCKSLEQKLNEIQEEVDNLYYDLKNLQPVDDENPKKIIENLEEILVSKKIELNKFLDYKSELEEDKIRKMDIQKDLENQFKSLQDKLFRTGKIYFEKKELSEIEQRKCKKDMENLETELTKLNLESENSLLISEQTLQRAKINLDRLNNKIMMEKEKINSSLHKFYMNTTALIKRLNELNSEVEVLVNENTDK